MRKKIMNTKKIKKIKKITGDIPLFYNRQTIQEMSMRINALIDIVNELNDRVEFLQNKLNEKGT